MGQEVVRRPHRDPVLVEQPRREVAHVARDDHVGRGRKRRPRPRARRRPAPGEWGSGLHSPRRSRPGGPPAWLRCASGGRRSTGQADAGRCCGRPLRGSRGSRGPDTDRAEPAASRGRTGPWGEGRWRPAERFRATDVTLRTARVPGPRSRGDPGPSPLHRPSCACRPGGPAGTHAGAFRPCGSGWRLSRGA